MAHSRSHSEKDSKKRSRREDHDSSGKTDEWLVMDVGKKEEKEKKEVEETKPTSPNPKEEGASPREAEEDVVAPKRIRTRSMDAAEGESIYSMSRYRISPETIGILNSKGITELFPIQEGSDWSRSYGPGQDACVCTAHCGADLQVGSDASPSFARASRSDSVSDA